MSTESIRLLATPRGLADLKFEQDLVLVVDVLRASTTIAYALAAGARGVIPVETIEEASRLCASLGRENTLLGGERHSVIVEGFDLGNSPSEYTPEAVGDKTLVFSTTNGARALAALAKARACVAASLVTLRACAEKAAEEARVTIVCAGNGSYFSREDFLVAGRLVETISGIVPAAPRLDDGARTALEFSRNHPADLLPYLEDTDHGRALTELGFREDLALAAAENRFSFVPIVRKGCLVAEPEIAAAPPR